MPVSLHVLVYLEKGVRFPGVEVSGGCELPGMLGNELRSSACVARSSNQGAMSLSPVHNRLLYNVKDYIAHVTRLKVR